MCGIVGIVSGDTETEVAERLYDSLIVLQHRGQDAAGIICSDGKITTHRRATGTVRDVFLEKHMERFKGNMGIGHVRYPTAGSTDSTNEVQPFYTNCPFGVSLAHNGNLNNTKELILELLKDNHRRVNTSSDSEALLNVLAAELDIACVSNKDGLESLTSEKVFLAVEAVHKRVHGSYAVVAMLTGWGVLGFRDPHGIRPLCVGIRKQADGVVERVIASESVVMKSMGFAFERDVQPGETVIITRDGQLVSKVCAKATSLSPCIFEFVYFARPDSVIDGISVHSARLRMGTALGKRILEQLPNHGIDVVIPVPDSGRTAALELAREIDVPYREGFVKNRYIGRTFIMSNNANRIAQVRKKLNTVDEEFKDKTVLIVDDSIVRGNTSRRIVQMAREAGAKRVYLASAAPPIMYPNVYGIDMPASKEYVAHQKTIDEIAQELHVDQLFYQSLDDLVESCKGLSSVTPSISFDCSCFNGKYVTGKVTPEYLEAIENQRSDKQKK
eukprot:m.124300 g.124300  ORF g.124300 m.124300 type:complete len:501 (+) comp29054_c0_seq2:191-1693(+)